MWGKAACDVALCKLLSVRGQPFSLVVSSPQGTQCSEAIFVSFHRRERPDRNQDAYRRSERSEREKPRERERERREQRESRETRHERPRERERDRERPERDKPKERERERTREKDKSKDGHRRSRSRDRASHRREGRESRHSENSSSKVGVTGVWQVETADCGKHDNSEQMGNLVACKPLSVHPTIREHVLHNSLILPRIFADFPRIPIQHLNKYSEGHRLDP